EAVSTGDPELVQLVLQYRDFKRATERLAGIPELLSKLRQARDFYVEMKWEFTSWDDGAVVMEVDHEKQVVYTEPLVLSPRDAPSLLAAMQPSQENTAQRLTSPIVSTHLNTRNISFERNVSQCASPHNPTAITAEEYFNPEFNLNGRDIGRPVELTSKVQSETHSLSLAEQVTPIIDLMAISNAHFAKLRDFITLRLPPGFPVKIGQCPSDFHCEVDPSVFEPPPDYTTLGPGRSEPLRDEDDNLLQFAIQQSLLDAGTESDQESLSISLASREGEDTADPSLPSSVSPLDSASNPPLSYSAATDPRLSGHFGVATSFDEQLRLAMELSCREQEETDRLGCMLVT
ncbi:hypothetical protein GOODEAATRI_009739, partial [Goodea atripinnis]